MSMYPEEDDDMHDREFETYPPDHYDADDEDDIDGVGFADPGGDSALRAETSNNPRNLPCPSCHAKNVLTPIDKQHAYQCNGCANAAERGIDRDYVCGGSKNGCEICKSNDDEENQDEE